MKIFIAIAAMGLAQAQSPLWEELGLLETKTQRTINQLGIEAMIFRSDPIRGYHIDGQGVTFIVPIRYRLDQSSRVTPENTLGGSSSEFNEKVSTWRKSLQKREAIKEANFEQVVRLIKSDLKALVAALPSLPRDEGITIIVEEHEPAYLYSGFGPSTQEKRRISVLQVQASQIRAQREGLSDGPLVAVEFDSTRRPSGTVEAN